MALRSSRLRSSASAQARFNQAYRQAISYQDAQWADDYDNGYTTPEEYGKYISKRMKEVGKNTSQYVTWSRRLEKVKYDMDELPIRQALDMGQIEPSYLQKFLQHKLDSGTIDPMSPEYGKMYAEIDNLNDRQINLEDQRMQDDYKANYEINPIEADKIWANWLTEKANRTNNPVKKMDYQRNAENFKIQQQAHADAWNKKNETEGKALIAEALTSVNNQFDVLEKSLEDTANMDPESANQARLATLQGTLGNLMQMGEILKAKYGDNWEQHVEDPDVNNALELTDLLKQITTKDKKGNITFKTSGLSELTTRSAFGGLAEGATGKGILTGKLAKSLVKNAMVLEGRASQYVDPYGATITELNENMATNPNVTPYANKLRVGSASDPAAQMANKKANGDSVDDKDKFYLIATRPNGTKVYKRGSDAANESNTIYVKQGQKIMDVWNQKQGEKPNKLKDTGNMVWDATKMMTGIKYMAHPGKIAGDAKAFGRTAKEIGGYVGGGVKTAVNKTRNFASSAIQGTKNLVGMMNPFKKRIFLPAAVAAPVQNKVMGPTNPYLDMSANKIKFDVKKPASGWKIQGKSDGGIGFFDNKGKATTIYNYSRNTGRSLDDLLKLRHKVANDNVYNEFKSGAKLKDLRTKYKWIFGD